MFLDTQIVSYAMKGRCDDLVGGASITSIVANEFLLVHGKNSSQANYYVPHPSCAGHLHLAPGMSPVGRIGSLQNRTRPFRKELTDSLVMEFGQEYTTIVEYGNFAVAESINNGHLSLYSAAVNFMEKRRKKLLISRFRYLVERGLKCEPVLQNDVEVAFELLARFKKKRNLKGVFRNTWNDILILAIARNRGTALVTQDKELNRFAAETYKADSIKDGRFLRVSFPEISPAADCKKSKGTKGYVNSGWHVRLRNQGNQTFR